MQNQTFQSGFTLLELMVAMTILGILTAIAIPRFEEYRARGFDTRALSDLRTIALAEEVYFMDNETYLSCSNVNCAHLPGVAAISSGVEVSINGSDTSFTGSASHPQGTGRVYNWNSDEGGLIE